MDPNDYYKFKKEEEFMVYNSGDYKDASEHLNACIKYEQDKKFLEEKYMIKQSPKWKNTLSYKFNKIKYYFSLVWKSLFK